MSDFRTDFEACLAELEAVTAELRSADPEEFTRLQALLGRRQAAIAVVTPGLAQATPDEVARVQTAWSGGAEVEERLKLVQAAAREQLREIYRLQFHWKALTAPGSSVESGAQVEVEA